MITYMSSRVNSVLVLPILISDNVTFDAVSEIQVCWYRLLKKEKSYLFLSKAFEAFPLSYQH